MIFSNKNKPSNNLLYRLPEIRWKIPPVNKSFTLRPVSILGGGGGLSSPIEYKEGTTENWLPIRSMVRIIQSFTGGGVRDQINFILTQPKFSTLPSLVVNFL